MLLIIILHPTHPPYIPDNIPLPHFLILILDCLTYIEIVPSPAPIFCISFYQASQVNPYRQSISVWWIHTGTTFSPVSLHLIGIGELFLFVHVYENLLKHILGLKYNPAYLTSMFSYICCLFIAFLWKALVIFTLYYWYYEFLAFLVLSWNIFEGCPYVGNHQLKHRLPVLYKSEDIATNNTICTTVYTCTVFHWIVCWCNVCNCIVNLFIILCVKHMKRFF